MPNIELHGFDKETALDIKSKVFSLIEGRDYKKEMVVTIYKDSVINVFGESLPFIRLASSCQLHTEEILEALCTLGYDVEHISLQDFYPKKINEKVRRGRRTWISHCWFSARAL